MYYRRVAGGTLAAVYFSCNLNRSPNCWCRGRSTHTIFYSGRYFFFRVPRSLYTSCIISSVGTTKKQYVIRIKCMGHERLVNDSFNPNRSERIGKRETFWFHVLHHHYKTFFVSVEYILSSSIWRENKTAVQGVVQYYDGVATEVDPFRYYFFVCPPRHICLIDDAWSPIFFST